MSWISIFTFQEYFLLTQVSIALLRYRMWILWPPLVFDQCFLLHSSPSRRWSDGGRWVPLRCRLRTGCGQTQLPAQQGDVPPHRLVLQRRPAAARGARGRPQSPPACRQLHVRYGRPKPNAISDPAQPKGVWVLPVQGAGQLRRRRGLGGERGCSGASHRWGASPLGSKRKSTRWDFFFRGNFWFFFSPWDAARIFLKFRLWSHWCL